MGGWNKHILDSEQSSIINNIQNNLSHVHWVKGTAGTGKSTVIVNFIQELSGLYPDKTFCIITYTNALVEWFRLYFDDWELNKIVIMTHTQFLKQPYRYHFVFLDEVQDISENDLLQIRQKADYLFVAGDCEQNIYEQSSSETQITDLLKPKTHELTVMHRLTAMIAKVAFTILPKSKLIQGKEKNTNADTTAKLIKFESVNDEYEWLIKEAMQRSRPMKPYAILFSFHRDIENFCRFLAQKYDFQLSIEDNRVNYTQLNQIFEQKGLNFCYLGNGFGDLKRSETKPMVYIMTIHSSKGLDFQGVFIPHLNSSRQFHWGDVDLERRMLFVATTRTRQDLFLTYTSNEPHKFLKDIPSEYLIHHKELLTDNNDDDDDGDIF